jgi:hypothetical protein
MKILINWFLTKIDNYRRKQRVKKKLEQLKKSDPFIYKH